MKIRLKKDIKNQLLNERFSVVSSDDFCMTGMFNELCYLLESFSNMEEDPYYNMGGGSKKV